jgi:hypothetical protein
MVPSKTLPNRWLTDAPGIKAIISTPMTATRIRAAIANGRVSAASRRSMAAKR